MWKIIISLYLVCFAGVSTYAKQMAEETVKSEETVLPDHAECDLYGTWHIAKVALVSDMYTGTTLDGDFEENLFDPAEYIGYELQYSERSFCLGDEEYCDPLYELKYQTIKDYDAGGKFKFPDIYEFIEEENIKVEGEEKHRYLSDVPIKQYEISFREPVKYGRFDFIPVGTQGVLLNRDIMLVGIWGKVLLAYRIDRGVTIGIISRCMNLEPFELISCGFLLIQKKDYSVINEAGNVLARIYYDMPVFIGYKDSYRTINTYYEERFADWFCSDKKEMFIQDTEEMREAWGDKTLSNAPFIYAVDTKSMLLNQKYVSIMQIDKSQTAGPEGMRYLGDTFDLDTGDRIPFDVIVRTDADTFRSMLIEFFKQQEKVLLQPMDDVINMYKSRADHSWKLNEVDSERFLNEEYFYDGEYLYLILNNSVFLENGCLLKWNQHYGDQAEMVLMNYFGENADELYEYYYY